VIDWLIEERRGGAQELHDADPPLGQRLLIVHHVERAALVLGSTQHVQGVQERAAAAGIEVARRRSGGGAVLLRPGEQTWVDVVVPAGDPLWDDDVERATWWLGRAWASALHELGLKDLKVHERGVSDRDLGRLACFAALGPGEVEAQGRKLVGISQRRTRDLIRLQCVVYERWDPRTLLDLLGPGAGSALRDALLHRAGALALPEGWSAVEGLRRHLR
jgi:lipoate-protein ligase A